MSASTSLLRKSRRALTASVAAASLLIGAAQDANAQAQVVDSPVEDTLLGTIDGDLTAGFSAVTSAITLAAQTISQAITASGSAQSMAMGQLLTAHAQEIARWQTDLKDNADTMIVSALPPNHCYVGTAQLAMATQMAARGAASSGSSTVQAGWTLGSAKSPTAGGPSATAASLVSQHITQAKAPAGGLNSITAQDLSTRLNGGQILPTGDAGAAALHPEYLIEAMTLDSSELCKPTGCGSNAWPQQAIQQLWDPSPPALPDPATASPAEVSRALARAGRMAWAEEPVREMIGNRAPGANLQQWAQGLIQQNGNSGNITIPSNISLKQMLDILVNQKYGGAAFTTGLANLDENGMWMEFLGMESVRLQLDWLRYQHEEMMGVVNGQQYAFLINKG